MIRAHMATFPPRAGLVMQAIESLLPQIDRLFLCLNGQMAVPQALRDHAKVTVLIPADDLKDAGKFAWKVAPDDIVFTVDDDIIYPADYVARTLRLLGDLDPARDVVGHMGHAWVIKPQQGQEGWRNFMFFKLQAQVVKVDILGTGTACQLGRNLPDLASMRSSAGFVDLRHARLHTEAGRRLWVLPHRADEIRRNLPEDLKASSLFETVNRAGDPAMLAELRLLMARRTPHSGLRLKQVRALEDAQAQGPG